MQDAKQRIRVNAVASGIVATPMHDGDKRDFPKTLQPMEKIFDLKDIMAAVLYLTEARQVTGEVLHVDVGARIGK
jgi:NAD(P)-dependent dehydrogenase (short-subunit alcohol dehydrogenase family)